MDKEVYNLRLSDISVPEIYTDSADFRFFLKWFEYALSQIKYDTENLFDLYDPQRCKSELLWMLGDTMGYKFDDRLPVAFNRLVLLYFMSMIHNKGSKNGVTLAAEVNLAQFNILSYGKDNDILYDRLEDTSIPVNAVYVTPHVAEGYIDVVYFSAEKPIDACIEYVRPLGMYCFQHAGVRVDSRTKISVDARLTNTRDLSVSIGATHVGHYRRSDYASLQKTREQTYSYEYTDQNGKVIRPYEYTRTHNDYSHSRNPVYYRNSDFEKEPTESVNPGFRSLYSLQLSNNEHIIKSLIPEKDPESGESTGRYTDLDPIFSLGYGPQDVGVMYPDNYLKLKDYPEYNLRYDRGLEESITQDVYTVEGSRTESIVKPRPAVNPIMSTVGEGMSLNSTNTEYSKVDEHGTISKGSID